MTRRDTLYLEAILNGTPLNIEPLSRDELFLKAMLEGVEAPYVPETRNQVFYKAIASQWAGGSWIEQPESESHTIYGSLAGRTRNMVVGGRTVQNFFIASAVTVQSNSLFITNSGRAIQNGTYWITNNTDKKIVLDVYKTTGGWDSNPVIPPNTIKVVDLTGKRLAGIIGLFDSGWKDSEVDKSKLRDTCIVSATQQPIVTSYFEGMKSFGQQENKINMLARGKNLLNPAKLLSSGSKLGIDLTVDGDTITLNGTVTARGDFPITGSWGTKDYNPIIVPRNKNYNISHKVLGGSTTNPMIWVWRDKDKWVGSSNIICPYGEINYIRIIVEEGDIFNNYSFKLQLEEGKETTSYESYKGANRDILLSDLGFDEGLRGIGDKTDELNSITNKAIKRIQKYVFTGEEIIRREVAENTYTRFIIDNIPNAKIGSGRLPIMHTKVGYAAGHTPFLGFMYQGAFYFYINNVITDTLEMAREFIMGTTVYYELAEPTEVDLVEEINLQTYNEVTHIDFENVVKGTSSFEIRLAHQLWRFLNDLNNPLITRDELFLKAILDGVEAPFTPQTRNQMLYKAIATKQATPIIAQ